MGCVLSHSVMSDSLQPTSIFCPWDFPGKNTGVGCHFLLQAYGVTDVKFWKSLPRHLSWRLGHSALPPRPPARGRVSSPRAPQWGLQPHCVVLHNNDLEHPSTRFFDINTPSFEKSLFRCFAHFLVILSSNPGWFINSGGSYNQQLGPLERSS